MSFQALHLDACKVVPFEPFHLTDRYVSWLNDPEVVRYSEQRHYRHTIESCSEYFMSIRSSGDYFLAIEAHEPSLGHIGNMSVVFDRYNRSADVSVMLGEKNAWGRGYACRAWTSLVEVLLNQYGLRLVTAGTMSVNQPMVRLMERSGMTVNATRPRYFLWEGEEVGLVMASKFA